jgi:hypothetical protein
MTPFYELIAAYKNYEAHFYQFNSWDERNDYCIKTIGDLQLKLSCFGLQWFCDDEPLSAESEFNRAPRRSFILDGETWDPFHSSLADSFFLYKGFPVRSMGCGVLRGALGSALRPGVAFETLCQVSSDQLNSVITSLEQRIAATNRPQLK